MTDTIRLSAEDIARALTKLLLDYHQQVAASQVAALEDDGEIADTEHIAMLGDIEADEAQQEAIEEQTALDGRASVDGLTGAPWEDLTGVMPKGLNLPMSPALYAKMLWTTNNVPKMSLQKIARMGAEMAANKLIAEHYKPVPASLLQHEQEQ